MSYTKFSKAVTKWLKANDLPCYGTAYDSPEETKARLDAWMCGSKEILRQWITDKRYRELISCAHGGWYQDDVIFEPLAEHFVANHLFDELRFLCERGIRFSAEDMLATIKSEKEDIYLFQILRRCVDLLQIACIADNLIQRPFPVFCDFPQMGITAA